MFGMHTRSLWREAIFCSRVSSHRLIKYRCVSTERLSGYLTVNTTVIFFLCQISWMPILLIRMYLHPSTKRDHIKKGSVNYHHKLPVNPLLFGYIFRVIFCVVRVQKDRNGKNSLIPCYRAEFLPEKFNLHAINDKVILLRAGLNISYDEGSRGWQWVV